MRRLDKTFRGPRIFVDPKEMALEERLDQLDDVIAFLQDIRKQIEEQLEREKA